MNNFVTMIHPVFNRLCNIYSDIDLNEIDYYYGQIFQAMIHHNLVGKNDVLIGMSVILLTNKIHS